MVLFQESPHFVQYLDLTQEFLPSLQWLEIRNYHMAMTAQVVLTAGP